ncbi:MAG: hypothetical protein ACC645_04360 [Pirellulales bacterium]
MPATDNFDPDAADPKVAESLRKIAGAALGRQMSGDVPCRDESGKLDLTFDRRRVRRRTLGRGNCRWLHTDRHDEQQARQER